METSNVEKRKRDYVSPDMRQRLMSNRDGRLTPSQWLDIAIEPLMTLLVLLAPAILILGPRLAALRLALPLLLVVGLAVLGAVVALRARRYARAPIHFARLYADPAARPWWMFWRPQVFFTPRDEPVRFTRRLAPYLAASEGDYLVYYLEDASGRVLLSAAPADHDDAESWLPTANFQARFAQRTRSR